MPVTVTRRGPNGVGDDRCGAGEPPDTTEGEKGASERGTLTLQRRVFNFQHSAGKKMGRGGESLVTPMR